MSAALPKYVEDHSHWVIQVPIRVGVIIVVTLILRFFLHRMIKNVPLANAYDPLQGLGRRASRR